MTLRRRVGRFALRTFAALAALVTLGAIYQQVGQRLDRRALAPPGGMFVVEGVSMHLHCTGSGGPTVVLEAGAYGFAQAWAWVQPQIAERRRVCSYDRAGLGWSDDADEHDGVSAASRLRALLAAAGEPGPFVLVGHSLGGAMSRIFVERYPDEVVALGLIEPTHPDQLERLPPAARAAHERVSRALRLLPWLARIGLLRLANPIGRLYAGLPDEDGRAARMFSSSPVHLRATGAEMRAWAATMAAARANQSLGDRPVVVISSARPLDGMSPEAHAVDRQLHSEIAALSTRGRHVTVQDADHMSLLTSRDHAAQVVDELERTIAAAAR